MRFKTSLNYFSGSLNVCYSSQQAICKLVASVKPTNLNSTTTSTVHAIFHIDCESIKDIQNPGNIKHPWNCEDPRTPPKYLILIHSNKVRRTPITSTNPLLRYLIPGDQCFTSFWPCPNVTWKNYMNILSIWDTFLKLKHSHDNRLSQ